MDTTDWYTEGERRAFNEGYKASGEDVEITVNPYDMDLEKNLYQAWRDGYYEYRYE